MKKRNSSATADTFAAGSGANDWTVSDDIEQLLLDRAKRQIIAEKLLELKQRRLLDKLAASQPPVMTWDEINNPEMQHRQDEHDKQLAKVSTKTISAGIGKWAKRNGLG